MKLIEKLKPEYKQILDQQKNYFPATVGGILLAFYELEFVTDIKYGIWSDVKGITGVESAFDLFNNKN
tara:strand:+ start:577 stop:780 length:204 start_codon:yes stop_codon:yes gene_type:complete